VIVTRVVTYRYSIGPIDSEIADTVERVARGTTSDDIETVREELTFPNVKILGVGTQVVR
jgi:hypothetical protein